MKYLLYLFLSLFLLSSCNKDEGLGGSSSLEGYVYEIKHGDDNYSFQADTFPALDQDVFIEFGDDLNPGDRIKSGREGYYRFDYLRKGTYTVYALSDFADGHKEAVAKTVKVSGDLNKADTIFIHTGKANGTAMIKGSVWVRYYNKGSLVYIDGKDLFPAVEFRVFIKNLGEETSFNDVRVGDQGVFIFQKITPGKSYEIYVDTEIPGERYKNILFPKHQTIDVPNAPYNYEPYKLDEEFIIEINN
jgi:hypothetical protein